MREKRSAASPTSALPTKPQRDHFCVNIPIPHFPTQFTFLHFLSQQPGSSENSEFGRVVSYSSLTIDPLINRALQAMSDAAGDTEVVAAAPAAEVAKPAKKAKAPAKKAVVAKSPKRAAKPKTPSDHPKISVMVNGAIKGLSERGGSSLKAIKKYITDNYKVDAEKLAPFIRRYLKSGTTNGQLVQVKGKGANGSFRLPSKGAAAAGGAKPAKAKKAAAKPKKAAGSPKKPKATKPKAKKAAGAATPKPKAKAASKLKAASPVKAKKAASPVKKAKPAAAKKPAASAKPKTAKSPKKPKSPKPKKATKPKAAPKKAAPKKK